MLRLWFNRNYATTWHVIRMIRDNPHAHPVHVLGSHVDTSSPMLAACDSTVPEPRVPVDDYVEWALRTSEQHEIDVFVPRLHMRELAAARDRFAAIGTTLLCPDADTVETFADKANGYAAAARLGLPVPPHRVVRTAEELRAAYTEVAAIADQVCMKPVRGVGGEGYRRLSADPPRWADDYAGEVRSLVRLDDACQALEHAGPRELMVMPFLDGTEISVDVLADRSGNVHAAIGRAHLGRRRKIVDDVPARELAVVLTRNYRVAYLSNTQVRYWRGRPYLLEVNTRAAGGIFQTALAGVNLPWAAVCLATGRDVPPLAARWGANYVQVANYVEIDEPR
jgi:biotin carboxylase